MKLFGFWEKAKQAAYQRGYQQGRADEHDDQMAQRQHYRRVDMDIMIGKPVILVPNEWCDPIIGFVVRVEQFNSNSSPMAVVQDELSGEERVCGGVMMGYSNQRLQMALDLDPYQLWAITAHNAHEGGDFDKPKSGVRSSKEAIMAKLESTGFFARWEAFEKQHYR